MVEDSVRAVEDGYGILKVKVGGGFPADLERVQKMNGIYQLPVRLEGDLSTEEILAATKKDKKMSKGQIRFILLRQIGEAVVDTSVTEEELCQAIDHLKGMSVSYEG